MASSRRGLHCLSALDRQKAEAIAAVTGKRERITGPKKPAAKKAKAAVHRLTTEWTGKDKKDVAVKDRRPHRRRLRARRSWAMDS